MLGKIEIVDTKESDETIKEILRKYGQPVVRIEVSRPLNESWKVEFFLKDGTEAHELTESFSTRIFARSFAKKQALRLEEIQEELFLRSKT